MKLSMLKLLAPNGAVTTLYMAFYVDSLAPDENCNLARAYYVGRLALDSKPLFLLGVLSVRRLERNQGSGV